MNKIIRFSLPLIIAFLFLAGLFWLVGASVQASASENQDIKLRADNGFTKQSGGIQNSLVVDTLMDDTVINGNCSLREAIQAANTNLLVDACPAGDAVISDTISFAVSGTIILAAHLEVTPGGPLEIDGGEVIAISGGNSVQIFLIDIGADLYLEDLSLVDGYANVGGGIANNGTLVITFSTLSGNSSTWGGGIANMGALTVVSSTLSGNYGDGIINNGGVLNIVNSTFSDNYGSGIYNFVGEAVVSGSIFSGNTTGSGGGIYNNSTLLLTNSTIVDNNASDGGGIYNYGGTLIINSSTLINNSATNNGGGIRNWDVVTISNSTISGNTAGGNGGGIYNAWTMEITNSTLSNNSASYEGGGISGSAILTNTIVANSPLGGDCSVILIDGGQNISSDDTCGFDPANGSMPNTDPLLGPLQDNGGSTWTHALAWNSPAIDTGDDAQCPANDQRGVPRPLDGDGDGIAVCDIGSYEFETGQLVVTTLNDIVDPDDELCSLREALQTANTNSYQEDCGTGVVLTDTITFDVAGSIMLNNQLEVTAGGPLVIDGEGVITISGEDSVRIFYIYDYGDILLEGLAIKDGANDGGGIFNLGKVIMIECLITDNYLTNEGSLGGGIYNKGTFTLTYSTLSNNSSIGGTFCGEGGGIFNEGILVINKSILSDNDATCSGGGIYNYYTGVITISNSTLSGNSAGLNGGGIDNLFSDLFIENSTLSNNSAGYTGGNTNNSGTLTFVNSIVADSLSGGDCFNDGGTITDLGHNISSDDTCSLVPANGSLPNTDPLLGPLQDNGGPTWTHALAWNSPAIDAGDDAQCPPTDQRGVLRPLDGDGDGAAICDIGSFEREFTPVPPSLVTITGLRDGNVGSVVSFTAIVEPVSTTLPIQYVWQASGHPPITETRGLTDTVGWAWEMPGTYAITVTASNLAGSVTDTHSITITEPFYKIYLPVILKLSEEPVGYLHSPFQTSHPSMMPVDRQRLTVISISGR